jgi:hypothetical protein
MAETKKSFEKYNGSSYKSYRELQEALRKVWLANRRSLPPEYRSSDLLALARRHRWIRAQKGGGVIIDVKVG